MEILLLTVHVVAAVAILVLVLLQQGKGADVGASFGAGSAGSVFGAAGSANFLSHSTGIAAAIFFMTSIALTYVGVHHTTIGSGGGIMEGVTSEPAKSSEPAKTESSEPAKTEQLPATPTQSQSQSSDVPK